MKLSIQITKKEIVSQSLSIDKKYSYGINIYLRFKQELDIFSCVNIKEPRQKNSMFKNSGTKFCINETFKFNKVNPQLLIVLKLWFSLSKLKIYLHENKSRKANLNNKVRFTSANECLKWFLVLNLKLRCKKEPLRKFL